VDDVPDDIALRGPPIVEPRRREHLDRRRNGQRLANRLRPFGEKLTGGGAHLAVREALGAACAQAASPRGALTSSGRASLATWTSAEKVAGSNTARSARFLRSTSTPAALRPWMNRL